jgi:hypothetical protein
MTNNTVIHKCSNCPKIYKNLASLKKHMDLCVPNVAVAAAGSGEASMPQNNNTSSVTNGTNGTNGTNDIISQMKAAIASASSSGQTSHSVNNKNYDINLKFGEGQKVQVDVKKHEDVHLSDADDDEDTNQDGNELKELLRPKVSPSYQEEIDKLENLIDIFKNMPISNDPEKKDKTITQLKNTLAVVMTQAQSLIKEMKMMAHRNSYYKNNIMLSAYLLDRCRHEVPDDEEDFENMFNDRMRR